MANGFQPEAPRVGFTPSGARPLQPDTSTAEIIEGVSSFAGRVRKEDMKEGLRRTFGESAEELHRLNTMTDEEAAEMELEKQGSEQLSEADRSMRRLRKLRKRGRISEAGFQMEAEKILRNSVQKAPGFEDDFRRMAASTLGFDPTGSTVQTLIEAATQEPEQAGIIPEYLEGTDYGRQVKSIRQMQALGRIGPERANQAIRDISDTHMREVEIARLESDFDLGVIGARRFVSKSLAVSAGQVQKDIFKSMFFEETGSGLQPRESVDANEIQQMIVARKSQLRNSMISNITERGGNVSKEILSQIDSTLDSQFSDIESLAENKDLLETMNRKSGIIEAAFEVEAAKAAPTLKMADNLGVAPEYLELLRTPEAYKDIARSIMPGLDAAAEIADMEQQTHRRVMKHLQGDIDWTSPEQRQTHSKVIDGFDTANSEGAKAALDALKKTGKPGYNISNYAKDNLSKHQVNPELQKEYSFFLNQTTQQLLESKPQERIKSAVEQMNEEQPKLEVRVEVRDGRLTVTSNRQIGGTYGPQRGPASTPASVNNMVSKLNAINAAAQNGWGGDIKAWSPTFLQDMKNQISGQSEEQ